MASFRGHSGVLLSSSEQKSSSSPSWYLYATFGSTQVSGHTCAVLSSLEFVTIVSLVGSHGRSLAEVYFTDN